VRAALHEFGYVLHPKKGWQIYDRRDEPEVTGAILTRSGGVRLPDRIRKVMRKLATSDDPHDAQRLGGYEGYEEMVTQSPNRRRKKKKKGKEPEPRAIAPNPPPALPSSSDVIIPPRSAGPRYVPEEFGDSETFDGPGSHGDEQIPF
jgi:hypothetical protein